MFNACICIDDLDNCADHIHEAVHCARKRYTCCECGCPIEPGDQYERARLLFRDEKPHVYRTCLACRRIRKSLFRCGWIYTEMWTEIHQTYCYDRDDKFCICPGAPESEVRDE